MRNAGRPRSPRFPNTPRHAGWWSIALITAVAGLVGTLPDGPSAVDRRWSQRMADGRTARRDAVALAFNHAGRGVGRAATLGAIGLELAHRRRWIGLAGFALAEAATPGSVNLIKLFVNRRRPAGGSIDAFGTSLPSGHAAYAAATTVALVLLTDELSTRQQRVAWIAAVLGTLGMTWSRTYLRLHWLTDVTAGALLGAGVSLAAFECVEHLPSTGARRG